MPSKESLLGLIRKLEDLEEISRENYSRLINLVEDEEFSRQLRGIMEDEEMHRRLLEAAIQTLKRT